MLRKLLPVRIVGVNHFNCNFHLSCLWMVQSLKFLLHFVADRLRSEMVRLDVSVHSDHLSVLR